MARGAHEYRIYIQKYFVYSGKSCTFIVSDLEAPINRSFLRPNFHLKWCWHCPPMVVDSTTPPGFLRSWSSQHREPKRPKYKNTMLSHDFKSKFQTISRVIYLPYHPCQSIFESKNQRAQTTHYATTACAKCQEMFFFQRLQPREYRNCSHGTQQRQGPSRTSLKGKRSLQDFLDTSPTNSKGRKDRKKRRDNHAKTGTKEERKNRKEGKERKNRKENERKEGNYRKGSKGRMNKRQGQQ